MKAKKVISIIILIILIFVGGFFYSYVKRDVALYNTAYTRSQMVAGDKIYQGKDFEYEFDCEKDNLTAMELIMTAQASKEGSLVYELYDDTGSSLSGANSLKLTKFKLGKFTPLEFKRIEKSSGHKYKLVVKCENSEENAVILSVLPDGSGIPAINYTYVVWDLQTYGVFILCIGYLWLFVAVLLKIFRK